MGRRGAVLCRARCACAGYCARARPPRGAPRRGGRRTREGKKDNVVRDGDGGKHHQGRRRARSEALVPPRRPRPPLRLRALHARLGRLTAHLRARDARSGRGALRARGVGRRGCVPPTRGGDRPARRARVVHLGLCVHADGGLEGGREAFARCVALDEEDAESWNNLASMYLRMGVRRRVGGAPAADDDDEEEEEKKARVRGPLSHQG